MTGLQRCLVVGLLATIASAIPLTPDVSAQSAADQSDPNTRAKSDSAKSDSAKPDRAEPDSTEPDSAEPDSTEPDSAEPDSKGQLRALYRSRVFESKSGDTLPYRILTPAAVQTGQTYPLVLFLHGAGERGTDNDRQLVHAAHEFARADRRKDFPAFVVFPQCPTGSRWVESDWNLESGRGQFPDAPSTPMRLALELVDELTAENPIDTSRRYVAGLSMGGQGAWYAAAASPHRFAAMLEICGGGDPDWATRYDGISIWAFHGQADTVVPVSRGREMIAALAQAGHAPEIRYVEYPGVGHDSWTRTFSRDDVFQWLFQQRFQWVVQQSRP